MTFRELSPVPTNPDRAGTTIDTRRAMDEQKDCASTVQRD
jgi:hypothetical protein